MNNIKNISLYNNIAEKFIIKLVKKVANKNLGYLYFFCL